MATPVVLHYGDPLMRRLATEHQRLTIHRDALNLLINDHTEQLRAGLTERNTTRLELDGIVIRRNGPTGIDILTTR
jgi:hypothetical protein